MGHSTSQPRTPPRLAAAIEVNIDERRLPGVGSLEEDRV